MSQDEGDAEDAADRGSVTVESAIVLAGLAVVTVACLAALACLIGQLRVSDAAREAARMAGRGDTAGARQAVSELAPGGATLVLNTDESTVTAVVTAAALGGVLPGVTLRSRAVAAREGVGGP